MEELAEVKGVCKSGRPWKAPRGRCSSLIKKPHKTFAERAAEKAALQAAKELESEMREERAAERRVKNEKRRLKAERKKENTIKHAIKHQGAQLILDTKKVKKMDLKARKQLIKMPPEYLQNFYSK